MNIKIYCVGHLKESYWKDACSEYLKRISKYAKVEIIEVDDVPAKEGLSEANQERIKQEECGKILAKLKQNDYICALDLNKKELSSEEFSEKLIEMLQESKSNLSFVIGGSLGLSLEMKKRANNAVTFSKMTFPHQLCRVVLLEQIYRGFKIYKNEPYHK